jgi:acyl-CoA dehydrogenase
VILPEAALIGTAGEGFKIAMSVLDVFRSTVGAAALGMARRALDEAVARVQPRRIQGSRWPSCRWCRATWPTWR